MRAVLDLLLGRREDTGRGQALVAGGLLFVAMFVAYSLLALSAYEVFGALTIGVTFFPPAGLTFAAFVLLRHRWWPAIALAIVAGELFVDMGQGNGFWWSLGWATANLTEPMLGASVARALTPTIDLGSRRSAVAGLAGGVLVGPVLGGVVGATVLAVANDLEWWSSFGHVWVGDALGVLVVAPVILLFVGSRFAPIDRRRLPETAVFAAALAALAIVMYTTDNIPVGYAAIPLLAYSAVRFGPRGVALVSAGLATVTTAATAHGSGPWAALPGAGAHSALGHQQAFLLAAIGGAWLLSIEAAERMQAVRVQEATAREWENDHHVALTLQEALMPLNGMRTTSMRTAGRYLPAAGTLHVGGDWYDVVATDEHRITFLVGDVVGHGLGAAATMGKLSSAARALALIDPDPAAIVRGLDAVARHTPDASMATMVCATLDVDRRRLHYASAGHPPPFLRTADGQVVELDGGRGLPLGSHFESERTTATVELPPESLVLLYTDGLIERRGVRIDSRIQQLATMLVRIDPRNPDLAADTIVAEMLRDGARTDDVAVLCLTFNPSPAFCYELPPEPGQLAPLRRAFSHWLTTAAVADADAFDLTLALGEAATNAVEHAYATGGGTGAIVVTAELDGDRTVRLRIADDGRWKHAASPPGRGRGLGLIRTVCDDVERVSNGSGTTVTLTRRVSIDGTAASN